MQYSTKNEQQKPCVATIGSFDGVHRGHQFIISQLKEQARNRGLASMVVTFANHPLKVLRPDARVELLTLSDEKECRLKALEVDRVVMLPFTKDLSMLSAYDFMDQVLSRQLGVKVLLIGYDNHFGHDRKSFDDYVEYGRQLGIEVIKAEPLTTPTGTPSSSVVRQALKEGRILQANEGLGYTYCIKGKVVNGFHIGTKLGFPTANIEVDADKLIPKDGVYCVRAIGHIGMMNIGHRPTLDNGPQKSLEVHLLDFDGNLYDTDMQIEFLEYVRDEQKFDSVEELKRQLMHDEEFCRRFCR